MIKSKKLKFGVFLPTFAGGSKSHHDCPYYEQIDWRLTCEYAQALDRENFDSIWVCDHMMLGKDLATYEGWTSLSYLAALTNRITIGTFLICNSYRNPALLAKMASTLDIASGGRLYLGIGAGWHKDEYEAYGYYFPSAPERVESLRETIHLIKRLWTEDQVTFEGKFCKATNAVCRPKPLQKPHPPIMVGAWGKKMLKLTAELANSWNIADDPTPQVFSEKFSIIEKECKKIGRDPAEIEKTWSGHIIVEKDEADLKKKIKELENIIGGTQMQLASGEIVKADPQYLIERSIHGTPAHCINQIRQLIDVGVEHFVLYFWDFPSKHSLNLFVSDIMPRFREGIPRFSALKS